MARYLSLTRIEEPVYLEPDDISFLRARIFETEDELKDLESQMDELKRSYEAQLANLAHQRDAKLVDIASYRNIYSPVRRLPQEILSEIFELYHFPDGSVRHFDSNVMRRVFILCRVCAAWKQAAHATPRLWSILHLSSIHRWRASEEIVWDYVFQKWLDRCRGFPLDLFLGFQRITRIGGELDGAKRLFESISRLLHNIRFLHITGPLSSYLPLFQLQTPSLPLLEEIYFCFHGYAEADTGIRERIVALFPHKISVFLNAPKLRTVEIEEDNRGSILDLLLMPTDRLDSLSIVSRFSGMEQYVAGVLLQSLENLVHLKVSYTSSLSGVSPHLSINLPALKSLRVSWNKVSGSGVNLLRCLHTPCLEELDLSYCVHSSDVEDLRLYADLAIFQQHSSNAVSSLQLREFRANGNRSPLTIRTLIAILSLFPTVQSFVMDHFNFDISPLLHALTFDQNHPVLLPKLLDLEISQHFGEDCSSGLNAMVFSRSWPDQAFSGGPCRLRKVTLNSFPFKGTVE